MTRERNVRSRDCALSAEGYEMAKMSAGDLKALLSAERYMRARDAAAEDMAHVLRSGGMSEDDIRAWKDALDASASADELKTVLGRGIDLMNARLADLQARYRRGAHAPPELLSPKSKATLDKPRQWTAPAAGSK